MVDKKILEDLGWRVFGHVGYYLPYSEDFWAILEFLPLGMTKIEICRSFGEYSKEVCEPPWDMPMFRGIIDSREKLELVMEVLKIEDGPFSRSKI